MRNLRSRLEKLENYTHKQNMGIPLMWTYEKGIFSDDQEQRSYMDWRLKETIAERDRVGNPLPIPIFMFVDDDDIENHIEEFRRYNDEKKEDEIHQAN